MLGLLLLGDLRQVGQALREFRWAYFPAALALTLFNYTLRFFKLHYLPGPGGGARFSAAPAARLFVAGFPLAVTPGKVGEALKAVWLQRATRLPVAAGGRRGGRRAPQRRAGSAGPVSSGRDRLSPVLAGFPVPARPARRGGTGSAGPPAGGVVPGPGRAPAAGPENDPRPAPVLRRQLSACSAPARLCWRSAWARSPGWGRGSVST